MQPGKPVLASSCWQARAGLGGSWLLVGGINSAALTGCLKRRASRAGGRANTRPATRPAPSALRPSPIAFVHPRLDRGPCGARPLRAGCVSRLFLPRINGLLGSYLLGGMAATQPNPTQSSPAQPTPVPSPPFSSAPLRALQQNGHWCANTGFCRKGPCAIEPRPSS